MTSATSGSSGWFRSSMRPMRAAASTSSTRRAGFWGPLTLPFALTREPIVRDGIMYGVTSDESGVEYVVRARIEKP